MLAGCVSCLKRNLEKVNRKDTIKMFQKWILILKITFQPNGYLFRKLQFNQQYLLPKEQKMKQK